MCARKTNPLGVFSRVVQVRGFGCLKIRGEAESCALQWGFQAIPLQIVRFPCILQQAYLLVPHLLGNTGIVGTGIAEFKVGLECA